MKNGRAFILKSELSDLRIHPTDHFTRRQIYLWMKADVICQAISKIFTYITSVKWVHDQYKPCCSFRIGGAWHFQQFLLMNILSLRSMGFNCIRVVLNNTKKRPLLFCTRRSLSEVVCREMILTEKKSVSCESLKSPSCRPFFELKHPIFPRSPVIVNKTVDFH